LRHYVRYRFRRCEAALYDVVWNLNLYNRNFYIRPFAVATGVCVVDVFNDYALRGDKLKPALYCLSDDVQRLSALGTVFLVFRQKVFIAFSITAASALLLISTVAPYKCSVIAAPPMLWLGSRYSANAGTSFAGTAETPVVSLSANCSQAVSRTRFCQ